MELIPSRPNQIWLRCRIVEHGLKIGYWSRRRQNVWVLTCQTVYWYRCYDSLQLLRACLRMWHSSICDIDDDELLERKEHYLNLVANGPILSSYLWIPLSQLYRIPSWNLQLHTISSPYWWDTHTSLETVWEGNKIFPIENRTFRAPSSR